MAEIIEECLGQHHPLWAKTFKLKTCRIFLLLEAAPTLARGSKIWRFSSQFLKGFWSFVYLHNEGEGEESEDDGQAGVDEVAGEEVSGALDAAADRADVASERESRLAGVERVACGWKMCFTMGKHKRRHNFIIKKCKVAKFNFANQSFIGEVFRLIGKKVTNSY